jgi:hypothetical protein
MTESRYAPSSAVTQQGPTSLLLTFGGTILFNGARSRCDQWPASMDTAKCSLSLWARLHGVHCGPDDQEECSTRRLGTRCPSVRLRRCTFCSPRSVRCRCILTICYLRSLM